MIRNFSSKLSIWLCLGITFLCVNCIYPANINAEETKSIEIKSFVLTGTPNGPLPDSRRAAMTFSGLKLQAGDTVDIDVSGKASGGPNFTWFDANGAPRGSQEFAGPVSDGEFPNIIGRQANIYSVIATIYEPATTLSGQGQWFLVGKKHRFVADRPGELVFLFHDAIYRINWTPAYLDNRGSFTAKVKIIRNNSEASKVMIVSLYKDSKQKGYVAKVTHGNAQLKDAPYMKLSASLESTTNLFYRVPSTCISGATRCDIKPISPVEDIETLTPVDTFVTLKTAQPASATFVSVITANDQTVASGTRLSENCATQYHNVKENPGIYSAQAMSLLAIECGALMVVENAADKILGASNWIIENVYKK